MQEWGRDGAFLDLTEGIFELLLKLCRVGFMSAPK